MTSAVPQPNFTQSMNSAALSTASANAPTGIPLSMTMVSPLRRGRPERGGISNGVSMQLIGAS